MSRFARIALLVLFSSASCRAAELTHFIEDESVGARISDLDFSSTLPRDLRSGLTNRVLIRFSLLDGAHERATQAVEVAVKYDLWDETFNVTLRRGATLVNEQVLRTLEDVLAYLGDLRVPALFASFDSSQSVTLKAEILLNPIERERMDRIREWISENSSYVPLPGAPASGTSESGSNAVFNRIFEQYASAGDVAAEARQTIVSAPFQLHVP